MGRLLPYAERTALLTRPVERTTEHLTPVEGTNSAEKVTEPLKALMVPLQMEQQCTQPKRLVVKCPECKSLLLAREYQKNHQVCPKCQYHFRLRAHERIALLVDEGSFTELAVLRKASPMLFYRSTYIYLLSISALLF